MVKSMTGFGRAEESVGDKTFLVDVKSLNGKQFRTSIKTPRLSPSLMNLISANCFLKNSAAVPWIVQ